MINDDTSMSLQVGSAGNASGNQLLLGCSVGVDTSVGGVLERRMHFITHAALSFTAAAAALKPFASATESAWSQAAARHA
jgi:hypothetical protein